MAANALCGKSEYLRILWQKDLGIEMEQGIILCIVTPVRLKRLGLIQSNECWKCKHSMGTFLYLMWDCSLFSPFWAQVIGTMEEWLEQPLPSSARLCLLGYQTVLTNWHTKAQFGLALAGFLNAAKVILRKWKSTSTPCCKDWFALMTSTASYARQSERLRALSCT